MPQLAIGSGQRWRTIVIGLTANLVVFCLQTIIQTHMQTAIKYWLVLSGHPLLRPIDALYWTPDLFCLVLIFFASGIAVLLRNIYRRFRSEDVQGVARHAWQRLAEASWLENQQLAYCLIVLAGMIVANYLYAFIPRYFTCAIPFLYVVMGRVMFLRSSWTAAAKLAFLAMIVFNVANAYGRFYPSIEWVGSKQFKRDPWLHSRSCAFTERSREYLQDHRSTQRAIRLIESDYAGHPVFVTMPHWAMMTTPSLGYVKHPLHCPIIEPFAEVVRVFTDEVIHADKDPTLKDPVFFRIGRSQTILPAPTPEDEILYDDKLPSRLLVFRKPWPRGRFKNRREIEDWYLDLTSTENYFEPMRLEYLLDSRRHDRAIRELEALVKHHPDDGEIAAWLARAREALTSGADGVGSNQP